MQQTLVIIKPDGIQRGLAGEIISRFERHGLKIIAIKMLKVDKKLAEEHYRDHKERPFFGSLVDYITSDPIIVMVLRGKGVIATIRKMVGALEPSEAIPGSIRGDFTLSRTFNVVHASDSPESAAREIALFFSEKEIFNYPKDSDKWLEMTA